MRKTGIIAIFITALTLSCLMASIASGGENDQALDITNYLNKDRTNEMFFPQDTFLGFGTTSGQHLGFTTTKGPDNVWSSIFQPCSIDLKEYCIESVSWRNLGSDKWISGSVTDWKPNPSDPVFAAHAFTELGEEAYSDFFINPATGLPRGGYTKVWNFPGATHGGGDNYTVSAWIDHYKNVNPDVTHQVFGVAITPVNFDKPISSGKGVWPFGYGNVYNFPLNVEYQVKIRMGKLKDSVGGWFNGRILEPKITQDGSAIIISGTPTRVLVAHTGPISCEKRKLDQVLAERCANKDPALTVFPMGDTVLSNAIEGALTPSNLYPNGLFAYLEPLLKPIGFTSEWNAVTWGVNGSGNCQIDPGKIALVSSNATLYSAYPPAWDPVEQTLAYQVGSLHSDHKGALNKGFFNLAVPKNFAKCLWGDNIINAKASVAVTNSDGTNNVATTTLSQDDQMIYFKVDGFTFSTPKIKVKLETPKAIPTPSAILISSPKATTVVKKSTITCVKGKITKKVTAFSPKCPTGYKKK